MSSMNNESHNLVTKPKREHGTTRSYVVGFLLSLVLTIVAYSLVVGHVISGDILIATILGFAMLQMIVQIVFFLHLGREPKPHYNLAFFVGTVGLIAVVVGGSMVIMHNLHYNMAPMEEAKSIVNDEGIYQIDGRKTGACQKTGTNHEVMIKDGQVTPSLVEASKCDTITFINEDPAARDMVFSGVDTGHESYAGMSDVSVYKGRHKTITLSDTGAYQFFDRQDAKTQGSFTVTAR